MGGWAWLDGGWRADQPPVTHLVCAGCAIVGDGACFVVSSAHAGAGSPRRPLSGGWWAVFAGGVAVFLLLISINLMFLFTITLFFFFFF